MAYSGGLLMLGLAGIPTVLLIITLVALVAHFVPTLRQHALLTSARAVTGLVMHSGRIEIQRLNEDDLYSCKLVGCYVSRYLVVVRLVLQEKGIRQNVVIPADACAWKEFRLLRKHLRLHAHSLLKV